MLAWLVKAPGRRGWPGAWLWIPVLVSLLVPLTAAAEPITLAVDPAESDLTITGVVSLGFGTLDLVAIHDLSGTLEADLEIAEAGGSSLFQSGIGSAIAFSDETATDTSSATS